MRPKIPVKTGVTGLSQSWDIDEILRTKTKTVVLVFGSPGNLQSQIGLIWSQSQFFGGLVTELPSTTRGGDMPLPATLSLWFWDSEGCIPFATIYVLLMQQGG